MIPSWKLVALILVAPPATTNCFTIPGRPRVDKRQAAQGSGGSDEAPNNYKNQPYIDPVTNRLTVDVSDLGVNMKDISSSGWNDPDKVHTKPGEGGGKSASEYVTLDGNIDWDAMARGLAQESAQE